MLTARGALAENPDQPGDKHLCFVLVDRVPGAEHAALEEPDGLRGYLLGRYRERVTCLLAGGRRL